MSSDTSSNKSNDEIKQQPQEDVSSPFSEEYNISACSGLSPVNFNLRRADDNDSPYNCEAFSTDQKNEFTLNTKSITNTNIMERDDISMERSQKLEDEERCCDLIENSKDALLNHDSTYNFFLNEEVNTEEKNCEDKIKEQPKEKQEDLRSFDNVKEQCKEETKIEMQSMLEVVEQKSVESHNIRVPNEQKTPRNKSEDHSKKNNFDFKEASDSKCNSNEKECKVSDDSSEGVQNLISKIGHFDNEKGMSSDGVVKNKKQESGCDLTDLLQKSEIEADPVLNEKEEGYREYEKISLKYMQDSRMQNQKADTEIEENKRIHVDKQEDSMIKTSKEEVNAHDDFLHENANFHQRENLTSFINSKDLLPDYSLNDSNLHYTVRESRATSEKSNSGDMCDPYKINCENNLMATYNTLNEVVIPDTLQQLRQESQYMSYPYLGGLPSLHQLQWSSHQPIAPHPFFSRSNIYLTSPDDIYRANFELWSQENISMSMREKKSHHSRTVHRRASEEHEINTNNKVIGDLAESSDVRRRSSPSEDEKKTYTFSKNRDSVHVDGAYQPEPNSGRDRNDGSHVPEDENNKSHIQKKRRISCKCVKSRCIMLYCDCFQAGKLCDMFCLCLNCLNTKEECEPGGERSKAYHQCLKKNKDAFKPKVKVFGAGCACRNSR